MRRDEESISWLAKRKSSRFDRLVRSAPGAGAQGSLRATQLCDSIERSSARLSFQAALRFSSIEQLR